MKKIICLLSIILFLVGIGATVSAQEKVLLHPVTGKSVAYGGRFSNAKVTVPVVYKTKAREMRGVWVATVKNIDFAQHNSAEEFKRDYLAMVDNLQELNFNAIFFQVRPMNDAFYPSKLNPWSRWMTGKEGKSLENFDPLAFMVAEAHKRNLEFHAWLNPYRVVGSTKQKKSEYLKTLDNKNFAKRNAQLVLALTNKDKSFSLLLNPGEPQVMRHILNTVQEIVQNYPVDAIHFDDYFYPHIKLGNSDLHTFLKYNPRNLSLENWRRANVNSLIYAVKQNISQHNRKSGRKVAFGVSPFGIWANKKDIKPGSLTDGTSSYSRHYADSRAWVKNNWVDYIVPQLYWSFSKDIAAYAALADWWSNLVKGTKVNLYIGQAAYRLGSGDLWHKGELADQLRYNSKLSDIKGSVIYSYRSIFAPLNPIMKEGAFRVLKSYWHTPVPCPPCNNL
ncbi:MAG: family 10 glycosylhydrolase [Victivallales bacterium]|jgi:uncharacterized lipoprotein YddW (UPF0748 family)|nr:family 10 glycosylhydrolase [Victivallales bacterium]